ncbi:putative magnesium transporter NIPA6 [Hypsizygus marmoreus]|uniref:Magnesium transporter NIPA6 n=1 Tax=Hypsizygus marmoreus TaxID=39966 RepID=A0A369JTC6_HYPMA|nr:putative magnesium transporter NIPA6 [Hypsizygus marmoreus]
MLAPGAAGNASPHTSGWHLALALLTYIQPMDDLPKLTTAAFIGIMVAITGNVLISLALNLQKLAHQRVEVDGRERRQQDRQRGKYNGLERRQSQEPSLDENDEDRPRAPTPESRTHDVIISVESQPLVPFPQSSPSLRDYGAISSDRNAGAPRASPRSNRSFVSRLIPVWFHSNERNDWDAISRPSIIPVNVISADALLQEQATSQKKKPLKPYALEEGNETEYLKSKLWWLGFLLMNVGEMGNFISYAWAPASVVAPLGTFALMANCIFAPVLLGERFRKRDLLGILIAIIGAVTVVLASNASDIRLDPDTLLVAITQTPFIIYSCVYVVLAVILATLSHGEIGREWVFVDVGLCALFGGFTVLSTKAISTLLTLEWIEMFSQWITYPVLAVLIFTGVGQIRYLNRALMRFDSKVVIPVQFVLFTLSAIIGSAILYGDFKKAKFHQIVTFLYGCAATFLGVFIIAWAPASQIEDDIAEENGDVGTADGGSVVTSEESRRGLGSIGRRRRATFILPSGARDTTPILRSQRSAVSLIGLSPAQHLLLVHTPPREVPMSRSPGDVDRRRTMSWLGDDVSPARTRDSSLVGRLRHGNGARVGSLDQNIYR